jgi:hypothetical protein
VKIQNKVEEVYQAESKSDFHWRKSKELAELNKIISDEAKTNALKESKPKEDGRNGFRKHIRKIR